jgi:hypothetical protein
MNMSEDEFAQESLRFQRAEQEKRFRARNEVNLNLENHLRNFQLPIDLGLLRRVLARQETHEQAFYHQLGNLKGQDYVSKCVENDKFSLFANLESDPESLEVNRQLKIWDIAILYKGYKFSPQFLNRTVGILTSISPREAISAPIQKKGPYIGFYFPDKELSGELFTFHFAPFQLGFARIPYHTDENFPQDYL